MFHFGIQSFTETYTVDRCGHVTEYQNWFGKNLLHIVLWHVNPLLGNDSVNTFPRQRIRRQQSYNFRCYATRCKYNNRGRGVFCVVRIYPLLDNGCFLWGPPPDYISSPVVEREWSESSAVKEEGFGWRLIVSYCNWLLQIVQEGVNKSDHPVEKPIIISHGAIKTWQYSNNELYWTHSRLNPITEFCEHDNET
jgi:hypothetical protein